MAAKGRHDPCVVPRAVPIVEAMAALVLADAAMAQLARAAATQYPEVDSGAAKKRKAENGLEPKEIKTAKP